MSSRRIEKINKLLKQQAAEIIEREIEFGRDVIVTVLDVDTSADLLNAGVIVSVFPENKGPRALEILNKNIYNIQQILNKRLNMRPIPKIRFEISRQVAEADKIEKLLEKIKEEEGRPLR